MIYTGSCHCGVIKLSLRLSKPPSETQVRHDGCGFCHRHGALSVTDPEGSVEITLSPASEVSFYRFALKTADFLVCKRCGVYAASVFDTGNGLTAVVNIRVLDHMAEFTQDVVPISYEAETLEERRARRASKWTPAKVVRK